jgi:putative aminopeptidase FrvX
VCNLSSNQFFGENMPIITVRPDADFIIDFLLRLLKTPSPTGNTEAAISMIEETCQQLNLPTYRTVKGGLVAVLPGDVAAKKETIRTVATHVDTLGAMVKEIKRNGRLKLTPLGGYLPSSVAGEYCTVETASGKNISGTVLLNKQSVHIHSRDDIHSLGDSMDNLEVRLDERTVSKAETEALGVAVGDFVAWEPRAEHLASGFIKSRHLDNKAGIAAALGAAEMILREDIKMAQPTYLYFSTYEEVGHGGTGIPADTQELLVVDMGAVGEGQASDEFGVSIAVKDSSGPYDLQMRRQLVELAQAADIPYNLDVYVNYTSDGSVALRAGFDVRVGLIGPGVDSSHAYERTHIDAIANTARLIAEYLCR